MSEDPNQQIPETDTSVDDIDARIAAERQASMQYSSYDSGSGGIGGFLNNVRSKPQLLIPLILVPLIVVSLIGGLSVSRSSNKQETKKTGQQGYQEVATDSQTDTQSGLAINNTSSGEDSSATSSSGTSSGGSSSGSNTGSSSGSTGSRSGGSSTGTAPKAPAPTPPRPTVPAPAPTPSNPTPASTPSGAKKVLIVVEENHSYGQVTSSSMPYAYSLTRQYGYATNYTFLDGDSLPNYIAIAAGTLAGTSNSTKGKVGVLKQKTVFKQVIDAGKTSVTYIHNMSGNCSLKGSGNFSTGHNPWPYFGNEKSECAKYTVPFTRFDGDVKAGNLPNYGMLVPDNDYNSHDGSMKASDDWFKSRMQTVFAGPDWTSGRLAVIFVYDEPKKGTKEKIYMSVIHNSTKGRGAVGTQLNHYSLTRLGAEMVGGRPLEQAANANSVVGAFGLRL